MKALILAAGLGSRLAPITHNCPKSLVPVNGKPILAKQIDNLHENNIFDITIVAGYKANVLKSYVSHYYGNKIKIIDNNDYALTNNMYSAYLACEDFCGEKFLMMNADVFYDSSIIKALLESPAPNAIATDIGRYLEESMKVTQYNGRLTGISKKISKEESLGVSIDIYKFSEFAGHVFFNKCAEYIEVKKEVTLWSEVALNDILVNVEFKACPLPLNGRWVEIDNHDDLSMAEILFAE